MKVSSSQKEKIRQKLVETAATMFAEKGFGAVTMRDISTGAGLSPATIYSYFPSKEQIFYAYFEQKQEALFRAIAEIDDFETFSLKEKLQTLLEMQLEMYLPERKFVGAAFKAVLDSPLRSFSALGEVKERFSSEIERYFAAAVQSGEMPPQPFERFLAHLFWDYKNLAVLYWLKDDSEGAVRTSRLIDMSLDIYVDVIRSGLVMKTADIITFLLRSHFFSNVEKWFCLTSLFTEDLGSSPKGKDDSGV